MIPKHPHSISVNHSAFVGNAGVHSIRSDVEEWLDHHTPDWNHIVHGPLGLVHFIRFEFKSDAEVILFKLAWM